jgi:uncharacterized protein
MTNDFEIDAERIAAFCRRWRVTEFSLFGSTARGDFGPDSDVDVLVSFEPGAPWSLWDLATMRDELETIFARRVDIVERQALRNPLRRKAILRNRRILYAA